MTTTRDDALLRLVYAEPQEDTHKLVYADWLLSRGDPRGELIMLQFRREEFGLNRAERAREQALLGQHMRRWLGPLATVVKQDTAVFRKGFLAECEVHLHNPEEAPELMQRAEWATVEKLGGDLSVITSPALRSLWSVGPVWMSALSTWDLPPLPHIRELRAQVLDPWNGLGRNEAIARFPGLSALELWHPDRFSFAGRPRFLPDSYAPALDDGDNGSSFGRLASLTIRKRLSLSYRAWREFAEPWPDLAAWLERCRKAKHLGRLCLEPYHGWRIALHRQGESWALHLDWNTRAASSDVRALELAMARIRPLARRGPIFPAITVAATGIFQSHHRHALSAVLDPLGPVEYRASSGLSSGLSWGL